MNNKQSISISIFAQFPLISLVIDIIIVLAIISLIVGISSPLLTLQKFYFIENQISLLSAIKELYTMQEWTLCLLIATFSIIFPFLKLLALLAITHLPYKKGGASEISLHFIEYWGKWSMLDVFVVALLLVSVKLGALAQVTIHFGIYMFTASILLSMVAGFLLTRLSKKLFLENR